MKSDLLKITIIFLLLFSACRKSGSGDEAGGLDILGPADETEKAALLIEDVNNTELKRIKTIYKDSEQQVEELKSAIQSKEVAKVKKIATELVQQINEGMNLGNEAVKKIGEARDLNTNDTYKEYLDLKEQALSKQLEAFEIRFEQTQYLRDEFQIDDKQGIDKAKEKLGMMDEAFKKKMEAARELSRQANLLAKESKKKESAGE
jgi:hypothetical protein